MNGVAAQVLARAADWGRAPSSHNTQPWHVSATGPDELALGWHADRVLTVGDPTGRDLLLSLGAVAEALVITAADAGLTASVRWHVDHAERRAATILLDRRVPAVGFTVAELRARRTARGPYDPTPVPADRLAAIADAALLPAAAALTVVPPDVVAAALPVADRWTFEGPATGELRQWLRLRPADRRADGLTGRALGLRAWEASGLRLALSAPVLPVLRATGATRLLGAAATARPLGTVVALTVPAWPGDAEMGEFGAALLRAWLVAGRHGLFTHPLSQLIDCPATAAQLTSALGRPAVAVFRLGVPRAPAVRSARFTDPPTSGY